MKQTEIWLDLKQMMEFKDRDIASGTMKEEEMTLCNCCVCAE
jgi:hypothetical protein